MKILNLDEINLNRKAFIDCNGEIWTIDEFGKCKHPHEIQIVDKIVYILDEDSGVIDECKLWNSLAELGKEIFRK